MRRVKIFLLFLCICVAYIVIISRIFYLSVINYEEKIDNIKINEHKRVNIVDRNGIVVASNIKVKNLFLNRTK